MSGYIYVIQEGDRDIYKIGKTYKDPNSRLLSLQTGNSDTLKIKALYTNTDVDLAERRIHSKLQKYWKRGEWFACDLELIDKIAKTEGCKHIDLQRKDRVVYAPKPITDAIEQTTAVEEKPLQCVQAEEKVLYAAQYPNYTQFIYFPLFVLCWVAAVTLTLIMHGFIPVFLILYTVVALLLCLYCFIAIKSFERTRGTLAALKILANI